MRVEDLIQKLLDDSDQSVAAGDHERAYAQMRKAEERIRKPDASVVSVGLRNRLGVGLWRLDSSWWTPIESGAYRLRRCRASDAVFYQRSLADPEFARRFNQQAAWTGDLGRALDKFGKLPPADLGMLMWIVCRSEDDQPLGFISLSSIQLRNRRAEFSIGFPNTQSPNVGRVIACLSAMYFAFFKIRMHKLYAYVYEDNPEAAQNILRLGFNQEGTLVDHFNLPPKGFVTVHTFGLTVTQALSSPKLLKLARRYTGQDWTTAMPGIR